MLRLSYDEVVSRIKKETNLSREEIETKVQEKVSQLSDLISKEGAAHIIANQLGIKLSEFAPTTTLKINEVPVGVSSVTVAGKVLAIYETREFRKNDRTGKVANFMIGDETGTMRMVVWDENLIRDIEKGLFKQDDVIKIRNAYSRENNGSIEIHLGNKSQINVNPSDVSIKEVKYKQMGGAKRKDISELRDNETAKVYGTVVQVFEPRYYYTCEHCKKKVYPEDNGFRCAEHGTVTGKEAPVVNFFLDDGTGNIRAVAFNEQAQNLLGEKRDNFEDWKMDILGKQVIVSGRVTKNSMFDRLELISNEIKPADPEELFMER